MLMLSTVLSPSHLVDVVICQNHQSKRAPLIPKPLLRKKRSFKRQPGQFGRSNPPSLLRGNFIPFLFNQIK